MKQDRVLVTGASSGIGEALALALARPGAALVLAGGGAAPLEGVAERCRARGAEVRADAVDVADAEAMRRLVAGSGRLDLVFANAGVAWGTAADGLESASQVRQTFAVNLDGVINTVLPAIATMRTQPPGPDGRRGRIAVIASVAAFLPYPHAPSYCASKAAVDTWTVATAVNLRRHGILLTSICPGFVRTRMTARNDFPMPGLMDATVAADRILRGVARGSRRVVFPGWMGLGSRVVGVMPTWLRDEVLRRQPSRAPPALS